MRLQGFLLVLLMVSRLASAFPERVKETIAVIEVRKPALCTDAALNKTGVCLPYYQCNNDRMTYDTVMDALKSTARRPDDGRGCASPFDLCCVPARATTPLPEVGGPAPIVSLPDERRLISTCGLRNGNLVRETGSRVHGYAPIAGDNGRLPAAFGEFPWMVALLNVTLEYDGQISTRQTKFVCSGSLINPSAVLTSASCVYLKDTSHLWVRAGAWDLQDPFEVSDHQDRKVSAVVDKGYEPSSQLNNAALIFLSTPVDPTDNVGTVCLPYRDYNIKSGTPCVVTGWGKDYFGKKERVLQKINLAEVDGNDCSYKLAQSRYTETLDKPHFRVCAGGEPGVDTCTGDGGSPLLCPIKGGVFELTGIVTEVRGCAETGFPGVYVAAYPIRDWIDQQMTLRKLDTSTYTYNEKGLDLPA